MIDLRAAARALGGDVIGRDAVAAPGPGHSPRDRSLTVKFDPRAPDGFLVYSHCDDDWRDCRDHVRARLGLPPWQPGDGQDRRVPPSQVKEFDRSATDAEGERRERSAEDLIRINRAREIWDGGVCPRATLAELYLRSRAITLAEDVDDTVLRFHEACPWAEGQKLGRRMLGVVHRAAVKLDPVGDTLHVGEGVETCLAARILGHAPTWALGSVGMIAQFPLVDGVACLRILSENDSASASASKLCANRWQAAGRKVQIVTPDAGCGDLNDELVAKTPPP